MTKPPVRHTKVKVETRIGLYEDRPICGATEWSWPEKWAFTEEYLHEVIACPDCKKLDPTLRGFDELLKEKYGDAWNDYNERKRIMTLARQERQVQKQTAPPQTVRQGLYLRQYARRQK